VKSMKKRKRGRSATQDSSSSVEDQPRSSAPSRKRQRNGKEPAVSSSSSEDDDLPIVTPQTKRAAKKSQAQQPPEESDEDSPLFTPRSSRKNRERVIVLDDSDSDDEPRSSLVKKRRLVRRDRSSTPAEASRADDDDDEDAEMQDRLPPSTARRAARRPRTEKEKAMEVLRRKKAGEKITLEDLTDSDEEDVKPLYDSDTDSEHQALHQFDDDSEGVPEAAPAESAKNKKGKDKSSKKDRKKKKKKSSESEDNSSAEENLDGFVVEDGPMGIPADALAEIPLEFTRHSHKPLREHFRDVLLWLILDRIFPGFAERKHELYRIAWQKLDDEISGLAQSKFASSAWRSDFIMALRARPQFTNEQIDGASFQNCGACGRSGHPATYVPLPPPRSPTLTNPPPLPQLQNPIHRNPLLQRVQLALLPPRRRPPLLVCLVLLLLTHRPRRRPRRRRQPHLPRDHHMGHRLRVQPQRRDGASADPLEEGAAGLGRGQAGRGRTPGAGAAGGAAGVEGAQEEQGGAGDPRRVGGQGLREAAVQGVPGGGGEGAGRVDDGEEGVWGGEELKRGG
jgi:hypothetical protein